MDNPIDIENVANIVVDAEGVQDGLMSNYDTDAVAAEKFDHEMWNQCERALGEDDKKRCEMIMELGENIGNFNFDAYNHSKLVTIGDNLYSELKSIIRANVELRSDVVLGLIPNQSDDSDDEVDQEEQKEETKNSKTKKTQKKKGTNSGKNTWKPKEDRKKKTMSESALKTIQENVKSIILESGNTLNTILEDIKFNAIKNQYQELIKGFDYIEFRILILTRIMQSCMTDRLQTISIDFKEELLIGCKKLLTTLNKIIENQQTDINYSYFRKIRSGDQYRLSTMLVNDFEHRINQMQNQFNIRIYNIANRKPKLIYHTVYDITIPESTIKPHDSQIQFLDVLHQYVNEGMFVLYKTLPGLGKTTMVLSTCSYIKKIKSKLVVLFCCSDLLQSVRVQVLRSAFNCGIKFAIGTYSNKLDRNTGQNYRLIKNKNCHSNDEIQLIVADYKTTCMILKNHEENFNKKLEETDLSKMAPHEVKKFMATKNKYLLYFDEPTILTDSIANETTLSYLSKILYWMPAHTVLSSATLPTVDEIINISSYYTQKHSNTNIREIISNKTLVGCFIKDFNSNIIVPHQVCNNVQELGILLEKIKNFPLIGKFYTLPFLINLNDFLRRISTPDRNLAVDIDNIGTFDQESVLENILILLNNVLTLDENEFNQFKEIRIRDIQEDNIDQTLLLEDINDFDTVNPYKLLTTHAFKYIGCCLIATKDPEEYINKYFTEIIDDIKTFNNLNTTEDYDNFHNEMKAYKQAEDRINDLFTSEIARDKELAKLVKPTLRFPKNIEVGSPEHMKEFARYVIKYDHTVRKMNINQEELNISEFMESEYVKILLQMGIGLFSKKLSQNYNNKVLELLSDRKLAYIIADESFCYGANYQISHVIVNDDLGDEHSINTILQLIGRTSRIGKSWTGRVYLESNTKDKILELFRNPTFNSEEGRNISNYFTRTVNKINTENEELRIKIEKEKLREKELEEQRNKENAKGELSFEERLKMIRDKTSKLVDSSSTSLLNDNTENYDDNQNDSENTFSTKINMFKNLRNVKKSVQTKTPKLDKQQNMDNNTGETENQVDNKTIKTSKTSQPNNEDDSEWAMVGINNFSSKSKSIDNVSNNISNDSKPRESNGSTSSVNKIDWSKLRSVKKNMVEKTVESIGISKPTNNNYSKYTNGPKIEKHKDNKSEMMVVAFESESTTTGSGISSNVSDEPKFNKWKVTNQNLSISNDDDNDNPFKQKFQRITRNTKASENNNNSNLADKKVNKSEKNLEKTDQMTDKKVNKSEKNQEKSKSESNKSEKPEKKVIDFKNLRKK